MILAVLLSISVSLLCLVDFFKRQYWKRKGVKQANSSVPFLGHFLPVIKQEGTKYDVYKDAAAQISNGKSYIGIYEFWRPVLVVTNLNLIEIILIKNFSHFVDHPRWIFDARSFVNESLFNLKGNKWRAIRYQMIPWFTTSRMKSLFKDVLNCITIPQEEFEALDYSRILTGDTISTFLGLNIIDKNDFLKKTASLHDVSNFRYYRLLLVEHFYKYTDFVGISFVDNDTTNYFKNYLNIALSNRNYSLIQRFEKLIDGKVVHLKEKDVDSIKNKDDIYSFEVSRELLMSTAGQFLVGGLDTSADPMTWFLYDLAKNPEVQAEARKEIRNCLEQHGGWTYDAVQKMRYVANCVTESMRLHPAFPFMFRTCTSTFTTPDGLTIEKGTKIIIPNLTIQMDPSIYPEPELFKPERFGAHDKQTNLTWLPFGEGPRKCPGMRFSLMVMRTLTARILENHELVFTEKTQEPVVPNDRLFLNRPLNKIFLKLNRVM